MKKNVLLIPMLALLISCGGGNNDTNKELLYGHAFVQSGTYIDHESETLNWLTENISNIKFGNDDTCARMEYQDDKKGTCTHYLNRSADATKLLDNMKEAAFDKVKFDMFQMFIFNSDKTTGEMQLKADGQIISFALKVSVTIDSPSGESLDFTSYTEIGDIEGTISIARRNNDQIDCTDIKIYAYSEKNQYFENKVTFYFPLTNQADGDPVYTVDGWFNFSPVRVK